MVINLLWVRFLQKQISIQYIKEYIARSTKMAIFFFLRMGWYLLLRMFLRWILIICHSQSGAWIPNTMRVITTFIFVLFCKFIFNFFFLKVPIISKIPRWFDKSRYFSSVDFVMLYSFKLNTYSVYSNTIIILYFACHRDCVERIIHI